MKYLKELYSDLGSNCLVHLMKGFVVCLIFFSFLMFIVDKIFIPGLYMELIYPKIMAVPMAGRVFAVYLVGLFYERVWPLIKNY